MTDNGIAIDDKLNENLSGDISLESILAEYGDFGLGVPPEDEVGARSRRIVMEALGETFTGVSVESAEADDTLDYDEPPAREYRPRRARKGRSRRREHEDVREYRPRYMPEREPEPDFSAFDEDEDVKVYRPGAAAAPPEGDEDVKVYRLGDVIAEAERRSANWKVPKPADIPRFVEEPPEPEPEPAYQPETQEFPDFDYSPEQFSDFAAEPEPEPEQPAGPEYEPEPEQYGRR